MGSDGAVTHLSTSLGWPYEGGVLRCTHRSPSATHALADTRCSSNHCRKRPGRPRFRDACGHGLVAGGDVLNTHHFWRAVCAWPTDGTRLKARHPTPERCHRRCILPRVTRRSPASPPTGTRATRSGVATLCARGVATSKLTSPDFTEERERCVPVWENARERGRPEREERGSGVCAPPPRPRS